jgi:formamidopyrimidine-DNA glycosylase
MSGKLEVAHNSQPLPHKHMELLLSNGFYLRFIDPRRFGMLDICDNLQKYRLFLHLGIEPLSQQLTTEWLYAALQKSHGNIKAFLMNQKHIVGIGNIYASEILFLAKISPLRISNAIKLIEIQQIITAIVQIISSAIEGGGSTLRDYVRADGTAGQFQHQHMVYGKQDQMCNTCHNLIAKIIQSGRSTFFCPNCQK